MTSVFALGIDVAWITFGLAVLERSGSAPTRISPSLLPGIQTDATRDPRDYRAALQESWARNQWNLAESLGTTATQWAPVCLESVDIVCCAGRKVKKASTLSAEALFHCAAHYLDDVRRRLPGRITHVVIERQRKNRKIEMLAMALYVYFDRLPAEERPLDLVIQSASKKLQVLPCPEPLVSVLTASQDAYLLRKYVAVEMTQFLLEAWLEQDSALLCAWNALPWAVRRDPSDAFLHIVYRLRNAPRGVNKALDKLDLEKREEHAHQGASPS